MSVECIKKIHQFINKYNLLPEKSSIIIGLSGGPDSVFLLHLLRNLSKEKKLTLIAAHLDHQWRADSANDVRFCHDICSDLGITFIYTTAAELPDSLQHGSKEEIGRRMRRYFLQQVRENNDADFIALGHHLQDQEETFFIRLIRGTTLAGLTGMKPHDGVYIRPLLETNKQDILDYLATHKIAYLTDPSNISESFLRNRIRLNVLPALQECDERFNANFIRTIKHLQQAESYLQYHTTALFQTIAQLKNNTWYVDTKKLQVYPIYMQNRLILHWIIMEQVPFVPTERFLDEIKRFLFKPEGKKHQIHKNWSINKKKGICFID